MTSQGLAEPLTLRQTNVSNPSVIHAKPSQQSITASEDYYSLSSTGSDDLAPRAHSPTLHTAQLGETAQASPLLLTRSTTPPETYRTPFQSNTQLARPSQSNITTTAPAQDVSGGVFGDEEVRKTPMHGEGKRRSSHGYYSDPDVLGGAATGATAASALRVGGIRRKPVPSTVMESSRTSAASPVSQEFIDPTLARSSVLAEIERQEGGASPAVDDSPYIRFAIDQLTRDEEVKGSRVYPDGGPYDATPTQSITAKPTTVRVVSSPIPEDREPSSPSPVSPITPAHQQSRFDAAAPAIAGGGALAALGIAAHHYENERIRPQPQPRSQRPSSELARPVQPLPGRGGRSPRRNEEPNLFLPVSNEHFYHESLDFLPLILRPLFLVLFILYAVVLLALLLLCAIWSLTHRSIFDYGYIGDANYFIFQYLPLILGMLLIYWLVEIQVAVYRIAPFIAMSSEFSETSREEGVLLPLTPKTFLLPYFGHFTARQPIVGFFLLSAWLQVFTIPLLASAFNVRSTAQGAVSTWKWIATAGAIWPIIALYILLILTSALLLVWLRAQYLRMSGTGLRWDPRSLADGIALLERSNALSLNEDEQLRLNAPILGYWKTSRGGNEVFHSYGVADRSARQYSVENGRLREKNANSLGPKARFSDFDDDRYVTREQRHSREKMIPKYPPIGEDEGDDRSGGKAVPWFLKTVFAIVWVTIGTLLLAAFLVASYLPSTHLGRGFMPLVPSAVSKLGFSGTNFLYSFVPAVIAMICFLGMLDIDYAYRRLQPYTALLASSGALAERSLLLSYTADLPIFVQFSSVVNRHWRITILSLSSILSAGLPILAGGCFWAEFYVPRQNLLIWINKPAFYILTALLCLYFLAILVAFPSKALRNLNNAMPRDNRARSFSDIISLVRMSRILDDVAFHAVTSKTDLVTRLLSSTPQATVMRGDAGASKVSLADSVRGFGRARTQAFEAEARNGYGQDLPRYSLGTYWGRDGREYVGVDRMRS